MNELERLNRDFGVSIAMLADETPTVDRDRWRRILDLLIARKTGVELMLETRADDIVRDKEWMGDMRRAGIVHIYIGVESQSQKTLDLFKKDQKVETSREAPPDQRGRDHQRTAFARHARRDAGIHPEPVARPSTIIRTWLFMAIAPWPYSDLYKDVEPYIKRATTRTIT